ncbi:type I-B CRISPR-associated protein Cas8b1/Cst1 [Desulfitibacter alkalitolerans]|uniref:type I-B CRISPR-associated protein Cas8b1/Cst1 n=1 Tax=Desulfitibacter alkalitolerans TaxID=264641 RepID=UPI000684A381|nr:type I-B CRISPR-associated protein Cas8b1/Cst1 [Desulfitibacter alkalitolerans]
MKNGDVLRLTMGDWQWNAAVVGFINIVGKNNVHFVNDSIEFSPELLEDFQEKYFAYFFHDYGITLSWHKIVAFEDKMEAYKKNEFENFNLQALKSFNHYLKDVKRYIKSNSYKAAYKLIASDVDMLSLEKQLAVAKEPKNQELFEMDKQKIIIDVKKNFTVLQQVISYCKSPQGKRYIRAKNVIYTIIKNAWNGVCFLNAQTKEQDVYTNYKGYFVGVAIEYLSQDKNNYKYNCFVCDASIKDLTGDLSFLNATGFDVARKSSHVWNFQNDIAICPLCRLVFSCLPAGLTYVYDRGIYVNVTIDLKKAVEINYKIHMDILQRKEGNPRSVYPALVGALHETEHDTAKYELADIQVVRYENDSYRFNILSRKMLRIILESRKELDGLIKAVSVENGMNVRIYDEVINRIFNNQNLFTLIHRMLYHKLANPRNCYFNSAHINHLLIMNQKIYKGLGGMRVEKQEGNRPKNQALVRTARMAGQELKKRYSRKDAEHKLPGICYRLLNALKTSNKDMFMDVILNCYLYVKSPVPDVITNALSDEKDFSSMGYAFVSALIDETDKQANTALLDDEGEELQ